MNLKIKYNTNTQYNLYLIDILCLFASKDALPTPKEKALLAHLLALPPTNKPFRGPSRVVLKKALKVQEQTFSMHLRNLRNKGWLIDDDINPTLLAVKTQRPTELILTLIHERDTEETHTGDS